MPEQTQHDWYDICTLVLLGATFVAVVAYTSVAAWQACLTRQQLTEMQAEQRPWVSLSVKAEGLLVKKDGQWNTVLTFVVQNTGKTPAMAFKINQEFIYGAVGADDVKRNCDKPAGVGNFGIFPSESANAWPPWPIQFEESAGTIKVVMLFCGVYKFADGSAVVHHTPYNVMLSANPGDRTTIYPADFHFNRYVPFMDPD